MRKTALVVLSALALGAAAPPTDPPTGSRVPGAKPTSPVQSAGGDPDWSEADVEAAARARVFGRQYAECVIKKRVGREQAQAVILGDVRNRRIMEKYKVLIDPHCVLSIEKSAWAVRLSLPADTLRYVLADALVNAEQSLLPADMAAVPRLVRRQHDATEFEPKSEKKALKSHLALLEEAKRLDLEEIFLDEFGECVVRTDPANARRLLMTVPETPDEKVMIKSIYPALSQCIRPGQKMKINTTLVRGTVAVNFYRLAHAARQPVQQGAKQ